LYSGIRALGFEEGDVILMPMYNHGSEIEALLRAGIICRFYEVGDTLEPDEEKLQELLDTRVRALFLIHYLGFPQHAARWREWCDDRGLLLIEDAAQAWLSSRDGAPVGSHGDLSIFCLYKTFGLPVGAAVISRRPPDVPQNSRRLGLGDLARRHVTYMAQRWGWFGELRRRLSGSSAESSNLEVIPEQEFDLGGPEFAPYATTQYVLRRLADNTAQRKRAANYNFLLERLSPFVPKPFAKRPVWASPFAFPIQHNRSTELVHSLTRQNVCAGRLWPCRHPTLTRTDIVEAELRRSVVILPVHQELRARDLEQIVGAVHESMKGLRS
jgi:dTDP-4-amino-4,6-dideoxygalactose transaminase